MRRFTFFLLFMTAIVATAMAQLNFSNDKVYTLATTRGWLIYNPDNEAFVASTASYGNFAVSAENVNCQWAIHKSATGKYYLYNIGAGKFIGQNSNEGGRFPWVDTPTNDIQIVDNATGNEYAYVFSTDNYGAINHFNHTAEPGVANWKSGGLRQLQDAGSAHKVDEVGSIDAVTLAGIERLVGEYEDKSVVITYEFIYEGNVRFTQTTEAAVGEEYPSFTVNFPLGVTAQKPAGTIVRGSETTIAIPLVVGELPFEYAASYEEITTWYNLLIHSDDRRYVSYNPSGYLDAASTAVDAARAKSYTWAFVGNPVDGFSIVNRLSGKSMVLTSETPEQDNVLPYMAAKSHIVELPLTWDFKASQYGENGFFIAYSGTDICLNRQNLNGNGLKVCYWLGGADAGSTFFVEECNVDDSLVPEEDAVTDGEIIDLGLSVKWRAYNVDASSPEELGSYYLWSQADIAQTHLGGNWYMPTMEEGRELIEQCTWEWMSYNGAYGYKVTGPNGNSIFMPAGGWIHASSGQLVYFEIEGNYWTSTSNGGGYAYDIEFSQAQGVYLDPLGFIQGWQVVRPVYHAYVSELDKFKEDKCYTITCERGAWTVADEEFKTTNDAAEEVSATNTNQHFAVLSLDGENYYLYSVAAGKFVKKDGSLVAGVADPIVLNSAEAFGVRRVQIQFKNTDLYVNINGEGSVAINGWNDIDEGNAVLFTEVGDFDATEALELLNNVPEVSEDVTFDWTTSTSWTTVEVSDLPSTVIADNRMSNVGYIETEITVGGARTATATFTYSGGACALNVRGLEFVNAVGDVVAGDYHVGKAGNPSVDNVYTVNVAEAGTYIVRCYAAFDTNNRANATNGNITISFVEAATDFSHDVTFAAEYATLYLGYKVAVPDSVEAYVVSSVENGLAIMTEVENVIPAATPVILKKVGAEAAYTFAYTDAAAATVENNLLEGSIADRYVVADAYVLSSGANGVGFYAAGLNKLDGTAFLNNANKAYLPATAGVNLTAAFYGFNWNGTTGIENVEVENASYVIYDLTGRQVNAVERGIYIVNGKKVLVK